MVLLLWKYSKWERRNVWHNYASLLTLYGVHVAAIVSLEEMGAMGILYSLCFVGHKDCTILVHISLVVGFDLSLHIYFINICFKKHIALHRSVGSCSLKKKTWTKICYRCWVGKDTMIGLPSKPLILVKGAFIFFFFKLFSFWNEVAPAVFLWFNFKMVDFYVWLFVLPVLISQDC